jgi:hypothetical protein
MWVRRKREFVGARGIKIHLGHFFKLQKGF